MDIVIYVLGYLSFTLAIGGLYVYTRSKNISLLLSSMVSIVFSLLAINLVQWWPLVVGFAVLWSLRLLGLDPGASKQR